MECQLGIVDDYDIDNHLNCKNNIIQQNVAYFIDGTYYTFKFEIVNLNDININIAPVWNKKRYKYYYREIISTEKTKPIELLNLNDSTNKYEIISGVHRCHVAKILGYKTIPAIIKCKNKIKPVSGCNDEELYQNVVNEMITRRNHYIKNQQILTSMSLRNYSLVKINMDKYVLSLPEDIKIEFQFRGANDKLYLSANSDIFNDIII